MVFQQNSCFFSPLLLILSLSVIGRAAYAGAYGYDHADLEYPAASKIIDDKKLLPGVFTVQGTIYCKPYSDSKFYPLKGGVVRITCLGIDRSGYETAPFSILSRPTDGNGYFLAKLSSQQQQENGVRVSQCKAFLHSSPTTCSVASDVNMGSSGSSLVAYRAVGSNGMRLYSVGPFVYTSQSQPSTPTNY